jgi:hypothetical protein
VGLLGYTTPQADRTAFSLQVSTAEFDEELSLTELVVRTAVVSAADSLGEASGYGEERKGQALSAQRAHRSDWSTLLRSRRRHREVSLVAEQPCPAITVNGEWCHWGDWTGWGAAGGMPWPLWAHSGTAEITALRSLSGQGTQRGVRMPICLASCVGAWSVRAHKHAVRVNSRPRSRCTLQPICIA